MQHLVVDPGRTVMYCLALQQDTSAWLQTNLFRKASNRA